MKRILVPTDGSDDRLRQAFIDVRNYEEANWARFKSTCGKIEATFRAKRSYSISDVVRRLDKDRIVIEDIEPRRREVSVFVSSSDGVQKHEMVLRGVLVTPDWDEEPTTEEEERQFYLESSVEQN